MIFSDMIDEQIINSADEGVFGQVTKRGVFGLKIFEANVDSIKKARIYQKDLGRYTTVNISPIIHSYHKARVYLVRILVEVLQSYVAEFRKKPSTFLAVGLGNAFLVSDSLGAGVIKNLWATHNVQEAIREGLGDLACLIPGVSGLNGVETVELVRGAVSVVKPDVVMIIDALTARNYERLGCSFQFSNSSMTPGGGVGGKNKPLSYHSLGVPIISIGVPMMINAKNFTQLDNLPNIILTPKEVDIFTHTASKVLSRAINIVVHGEKHKNFF